MASRATGRYRDTIDASPEKSESKSSEAVVSTSREQKVSNDPVVSAACQADTNGLNFLSSLLHATIFFDYFEYVASKTHKGDSSEQKVVKLKATHPTFYSFCIIGDLFIVSVAVMLLIVAAAGAVFKVIWGDI